MSRETEAKISLLEKDLAELRSKLKEYGARLCKPRLLEENTFFDFPDRRLQEADSALRVRVYGKEYMLTYKGASQEHPLLKLREEIETRVDDALELMSLLKIIGFECSFFYRKHREIYDLELSSGLVEISLDETPFGCFAEIEGSEEAIQSAVDILGWDTTFFVNETYAQLYLKHTVQMSRSE